MIKITKASRKEYGIAKSGDILFFTVSLPAFNKAELVIYDLNGLKINSFDIAEYKLAGSVFSFSIESLEYTDGFQYEYLCDDEVVLDPYMTRRSGKREYGVKKDEKYCSRAIYMDDAYDFETDRQLNLDFSDIVAYQLHVRGFTKHSSSKVSGKGCFKGVIEKIPYLTGLGINQIEIMPAYDFCEFDSEKDTIPNNHPAYVTDVTLNEKGDVIKNEPKVKLNYWGFKKGNYFCPKYEYSYSDDAVTEFKDMVKALHKAGIELIMQMFFPKNTKAGLIVDALRYWYIEYHVDGFHVMGENLPQDSIISDNILADAKLYINNLDRHSDVAFEYAGSRKLCSVNDRFLTSVRKYLKSDSNSLSDFIYSNRNNPSDVHNVNYISCYEGFTLSDLVSYEYKHNEDNGENNRDGRDYNISWNCGVEGKSSKKAVKELRMRQAKNAICMLLLSQATPMLFMGDELLNSQKGNNNPYCQDNDISWINWKSSKSSLEFLEFTKMLIKYRKNHSIIHQNGELKSMDYISCGSPDISYHQDMAWKSELNNYLLHIGIMLDGRYAKIAAEQDESLYFAYNMHWENHMFGLPRLKKNTKWEVVFTTADKEECEEIIKDLADSQEEICVYKRSVLVLKTVKEEK